MGRLRQPGAPYRHSETPWSLRRPAPTVGQHNEDVFCGELGVHEETLRSFESGGII
jgi:crotonobetainyl-CoA:carnitine CoA-transferase CaiB-like acyl-CoA transferase